MGFTPWQTFLDESGHLNPQERKLPLKERFRLEEQRIKQWPFKQEEVRQKRFARLRLEQNWLECEQPYYNVHPGLVGSLSRCNLDNIPVSQIEMPGGFSVANIRFAEKHPDLQLLGALVNISSHQVNLFADFGERQSLGNNFFANLGTSLVADFLPEETIPDLFARMIVMPVPAFHIMATIDVSKCLLNFFRLAIAMGFLVNADEEHLCQHDVLSKDLRAYEDALTRGNKDKEQIIVERAKRRGKLGWNVGTNEMFIGEVPVSSSSHADTGERELRWSHLRTGHPHAVRFGEGKRMVKIKWFRPTRVRSDLPFKKD